MADDEIKQILKDIKANLSMPGEGSATELIKEVRDSLRGASEPTVAGSIAVLQRALTDEFTKLKNVIRDDGGAGRSVGHPSGPSPDSPELERIARFLEGMESVLLRMETAIVGLRDGGGGRGGEFGGVRPDKYFEREMYISTRKLAQSILDGSETISSAFAKLSAGFGLSFKSVFTDFIQSILNLTIKAGDLSAQFRNLHGVMKNEIGQLTQQGVYGSNSLGPFEHAFEGWKRLMDGVFTETDSFKNTLVTVQRMLQDNLASPLALTGRDVTELAKDFRDARIGMRQQGFDARAWMSTEAANKALSDMLEWQHTMGIRSMANDQITVQNTAQELNFLKMIASYTGKTVESLEAQLNVARRQEQMLVGIGALSPEESKRSTMNMAALQAKIGDEEYGKLKPLLDRLLYFGNSMTEAAPLMSQKAPDMLKSFQQMPQVADLLFELNRQRVANPGEANTARMLQILGQLNDSLAGFRQTGRTGTGRYELEARYGGFAQELAGLFGGSNLAKTAPAADAAQRDRQNDIWGYKLIGTFQDWITNHLQPLFGGLGGAVGANIAALAFNSAALISLRGAMLMPGGGLWAGLGGLKGLAKGATMVGAGLGVVTEGVSAVGDIRQGRTGSGVGTFAGFGVGAAVGGALGTLTDWFTGPFGTIVGASIGGYLGNWIGSKFDKPAQEPPAVGGALGTLTDWFTGPFGTIVGSSIGGYLGNWIGSKFDKPAQEPPAVGAPQNMAGPGGFQGFAAQNGSYQDASLGLIGQLIQATQSGNYILGQIYGETARQTGLLRGDPNGAGGGIPVGANGQVTPPPIGRPDGSYAYVPGF